MWIDFTASDHKQTVGNRVCQFSQKNMNSQAVIYLRTYLKKYSWLSTSNITYIGTYYAAECAGKYMCPVLHKFSLYNIRIIYFAYISGCNYAYFYNYFDFSWG